MSRRGSGSHPGRHSSSGSGSGRGRGGGSGSSGPGGSNKTRRGHETVACRHYRRNCNMVAPCCDTIVCCHQGHDESSRCRVRLDKRHVNYIVCCSCKASQHVGKACINCNKSFGQKSCLRCRMWYSGDGFHCNACDVCRKGREKDWWHCEVCNTCLAMRSARNHPCLNSSNKNCAICGADTHRSRRPSTKMSCGHMAHCECFLSHVQTSYNCPLPYCKKTVANMREWENALKKIDAGGHAQNGTSPVKIYCFNCRRTSVVHGNSKTCKGANCGSQNTIRIPFSQKHMPFALPPRKMPPG